MADQVVVGSQSPKGNSGPPQGKKSLLSNTSIRLAIAFFVIAIVVFAGLALYIQSKLSSVRTIQVSVPVNPTVNYRIISQDALFYNYSTSYVPYVLVNYSTTNAFLVSFNYTIYTRSPQLGQVYLLNWTGQCYECGNPRDIIAPLLKNLSKQGVSNQTQIQIVSQQSLQYLSPGSILVIMNGLMPDYMVNSYVDGQQLITYLLDKGVIIVYIGGDTSHLVSSQNLVVPASGLPGYLVTGVNTRTSTNSTFYTNRTDWGFGVGGSRYGPLSYIDYGNGTIIGFADYPSAMNTTHLSSDIAYALALEFWLPVIGASSTQIQLKDQRSDNGIAGLTLVPIALSNPSMQNFTNDFAKVDSDYGKLTATATGPQGNITVKNLYFHPHLSANGTFSVPGLIYPGEVFNATINIFVNSTTQLEPHLDILNQNLSRITSFPPLFSKTVSPPNFTFIKQLSFTFSQGMYIAVLRSFTNQEYAAALFTAPQVVLSLSRADINASTFTFYISAASQPLSNVSATVSYDGNYTESLPISNGTFTYSLPHGVSVSPGVHNFTVFMLYRNYTYQYTYTPPAFSINNQYIEFIGALLVVILEITLIKAPARDEFYMDVPAMPKQQSAKIKIRENEFLSVFDKLNNYYHWKYMPLSMSEFRVGVTNNIHYNVLPVMLTYKNIETILDSMVEHGDLTSADGLYAPRAWIDQSKHDIEYLATFKKMRVYLVSHAHIFTDLDKSDSADIVTTLHNEKAYIIIYSKTSRFSQKIPVVPGVKTYLAFLNGDRLEEFKNRLYETSSNEAEILRMNISVGNIVLIDADSPEGILT